MEDLQPRRATKVNFAQPIGSLQDYPHRLNVLLHSRRFFLGTALFGVASAVALPAALIRRGGVDGQVNPGLLRRALDALEQHRDSIVQRDLIGIADFSLPSRTPRFHLV